MDYEIVFGKWDQIIGRSVLGDRIHKGTIAIARDEKTRLYLFPDEPNTLNQLQRLHTGQLKHLRFL